MTIASVMWPLIRWMVGRSTPASTKFVIACTGSEPMKDKYGTNYKPKLELVKWINRPAELPDESPVADSDVWQEAAPSQPAAAAHVPPPPPPATPATPSSPAPQTANDLATAEF